MGSSYLRFHGHKTFEHITNPMNFGEIKERSVECNAPVAKIVGNFSSGFPGAHDMQSKKFPLPRKKFNTNVPGSAPSEVSTISKYSSLRGPSKGSINNSSKTIVHQSRPGKSPKDEVLSYEQENIDTVLSMSKIEVEDTLASVSTIFSEKNLEFLRNRGREQAERGLKKTQPAPLQAKNISEDDDEDDDMPSLIQPPKRSNKRTNLKFNDNAVKTSNVSSMSNNSVTGGEVVRFHSYVNRFDLSGRRIVLVCSDNNYSEDSVGIVRGDDGIRQCLLEDMFGLSGPGLPKTTISKTSSAGKVKAQAPSAIASLYTRCNMKNECLSKWSDAQKLSVVDLILSTMCPVLGRGANVKPNSTSSWSYRGIILTNNSDRTEAIDLDDTDRELYNHEREPLLPGFSLTDICELFRSQVPTQRVIALRMLIGLLWRRDMLLSIASYHSWFDSRDTSNSQVRHPLFDKYFDGDSTIADASALLARGVHNIVLHIRSIFSDIHPSRDISLQDIYYVIVPVLCKHFCASDLPVELPTLLLWAISQLTNTTAAGRSNQEHSNLLSNAAFTRQWSLQSKVMVMQCFKNYICSPVEENVAASKVLLGGGFGVVLYGTPRYPVPHTIRSDTYSYTQYIVDVQAKRRHFTSSSRDGSDVDTPGAASSMVNDVALKCRYGRIDTLFEFSDVVGYLKGVLGDCISAMLLLVVSNTNPQSGAVAVGNSSQTVMFRMGLLALEILTLAMRNCEEEFAFQPQSQCNSEDGPPRSQFMPTSKAIIETVVVPLWEKMMELVSVSKVDSNGVLNEQDGILLHGVVSQWWQLVHCCCQRCSPEMVITHTNGDNENQSRTIIEWFLIKMRPHFISVVGDLFSGGSGKYEVVIVYIWRCLIATVNQQQFVWWSQYTCCDVDEDNIVCRLSGLLEIRAVVSTLNRKLRSDRTVERPSGMSVECLWFLHDISRFVGMYAMQIKSLADGDGTLPGVWRRKMLLCFESISALLSVAELLCSDVCQANNKNCLLELIRDSSQIGNCNPNQEQSTYWWCAALHFLGGVYTAANIGSSTYKGVRLSNISLYDSVSALLTIKNEVDFELDANASEPPGQLDCDMLHNRFLGTLKELHEYIFITDRGIFKELLGFIFHGVESRAHVVEYWRNCELKTAVLKLITIVSGHLEPDGCVDEEVLNALCMGSQQLEVFLDKQKASEIKSTMNSGVFGNQGSLMYQQMLTELIALGLSWLRVITPMESETVSKQMHFAKVIMGLLPVFDIQYAYVVHTLTEVVLQSILGESAYLVDSSTLLELRSQAHQLIFHKKLTPESAQYVSKSVLISTSHFCLHAHRGGASKHNVSLTSWINCCGSNLDIVSEEPSFALGQSEKAMKSPPTLTIPALPLSATWIFDLLLKFKGKSFLYWCEAVAHSMQKTPRSGPMDASTWYDQLYSMLTLTTDDHVLIWDSIGASSYVSPDSIYYFDGYNLSMETTVEATQQMQRDHLFVFHSITNVMLSIFLTECNKRCEKLVEYHNVGLDRMDSDSDLVLVSATKNPTSSGWKLFDEQKCTELATKLIDATSNQLINIMCTPETGSDGEDTRFGDNIHSMTLAIFFSELLFPSHSGVGNQVNSNHYWKIREKIWSTIGVEQRLLHLLECSALFSGDSGALFYLLPSYWWINCLQAYMPSSLSSVVPQFTTSASLSACHMARTVLKSLQSIRSKTVDRHLMIYKYGLFLVAYAIITPPSDTSLGTTSSVSGSRARLLCSLLVDGNEEIDQQLVVDVLLMMEMVEVDMKQVLVDHVTETRKGCADITSGIGDPSVMSKSVSKSFVNLWKNKLAMEATAVSESHMELESDPLPTISGNSTLLACSVLTRKVVVPKVSPDLELWLIERNREQEIKNGVVTCTLNDILLATRPNILKLFV